MRGNAWSMKLTVMKYLWPSSLSSHNDFHVVRSCCYLDEYILSSQKFATPLVYLDAHRWVDLQPGQSWDSEVLPCPTYFLLFLLPFLLTPLSGLFFQIYTFPS